METKVCSKCKKKKPLSEFYFLNDKGRYCSQCRECVSRCKKEYQKKNSEKIREHRKEYNQRPEVKKRSKEVKREYRKTEKYKKGQKKYREENKEKIREYSREYEKNRKANDPEYREKIREYSREYDKNRRTNDPGYREKIREYSREYGKNRRANDPEFRLSHNTTTAIGNSLKGNKNRRHWETLVGYSLQDLMDRLSVNFQKGMSFENYGKWEIDHIKPKSLFHYKTPEDQAFKDCWCLANLQPLWAKDNNSKNNKW